MSSTGLDGGAIETAQGAPTNRRTITCQSRSRSVRRAASSREAGWQAKWKTILYGCRSMGSAAPGGGEAFSGLEAAGALGAGFDAPAGGADFAASAGSAGARVTTRRT